PWSRPNVALVAPRHGRVGVPLPGQAEPEEPAAAAAWVEARELAATRWELVEVDVTPLLEAAPLLYAAWVAERTTDLAEAIRREPEGLQPTLAGVVGGRWQHSALR